MDSMHSQAFPIVFMVVMAVVPAVAYVALRLYAAHEAASDHPVTRH